MKQKKIRPNITDKVVFSISFFYLLIAFIFNYLFLGIIMLFFMFMIIYLSIERTKTMILSDIKTKLKKFQKGDINERQN